MYGLLCVVVDWVVCVVVGIVVVGCSGVNSGFLLICLSVCLCFC